MDFEQAYAKCKRIRERNDLELNPALMPNLRQTFIGRDGEEHNLRLRYYQVQGVLHLVLMNRFLLGDDLGLGKTIMAITALCIKWKERPDQKVMVLAPKSGVRQWESEFRKFTRGVQTFVVTGNPNVRALTYIDFRRSRGPSVLIMNYEKARIDFRLLQNWSDYILIADEATKFKESRSQTHQVVRHLSSMVETMWSLTGTMIKNNLLEGYSIIECMLPGTFGVRAQFLRNFCVTRMIDVGGGGKKAGKKSGRKIQVVVGYSKRHIAEFKRRIEPVFLGRAKWEVASDLPVLVTKRVTVGLTPQQHSKYLQSLAGMIAVDDPKKRGDEFIETNKLTALVRCQQIVNHPSLIDCDGGSEKMDALLDILDGELKDEKVIVFSRFRTMVDIIIPILDKKGLAPVRVTGSETDKQRAGAIESFQEKKSDTRAICITMAGGDAINLQAAKAVIFYDLPFSAGDYLQIIGRAIRIGSDHDRCLAIHLVAEDTIDEHVETVLDKKMALIEAVIGKRIKGEHDTDTVVRQENEISEIYNLMVQDAKRSSGGSLRV